MVSVIVAESAPFYHTETPAGTDEFVFSDNGTLKRVDFSLMNNSPIFYAHNQNSQTISNNTHTVVQFDTDSATGDFDPDSKFDTISNNNNSQD